MDNFYVHLHSDASSHHFSDNTRINFRNHLALPITVNAERFEVALSEMTYVYNTPHIKAGTKLFTIIASDSQVEQQATTKLIKYENVFEMKGTNSETKMYPANATMFEYAKNNFMHLSESKDIFEAEEWNVDTTQIQLLHTTMNIVSSKDITSIEELIGELNTLLTPVSIEFVRETSGTIDKITAKQNKPHIIANRELAYAPTVKKLFGLEKDDDEYYYDSDEKNFHHRSSLEISPFNLLKGSKLLSLEFYKGEIRTIPMTFGNEKIETGTLLTALASRDLYTIEDLAREITKVRPNIIRLEVVGGRAQLLAMLPKDCQIKFTERVMSILELDMTDETIFPKGTLITINAKNNVMWNVGMKKIYVYTDCVKSQRIGDQIAPLLRMTGYTGGQEELVIKEFNNLQYLPLSKDFIDSIKVYLRTEVGEDLPLTFGTVTITLHFREKRF
nr:TPA_asm: penton [Orchesella springtail adintovirus]